jgi:DNA primase
MSDWQAERLAAMNKSILVALDNDDAGLRASESVYKCLLRNTPGVEVFTPPSPFKDVGEMPVEEVRRWLEPRRSLLLP